MVDFYNKIFAKNAFEGKNVIISGGAGDIGFEIAKAFFQAGANKIALLDKEIERLNEVGKQFKNHAIPISVDLADPADIESAVKKIYNQDSRWDILINAAGIYVGGTLVNSKVEDWDKLMAINARSVFLLSKLVAEKMIAENGGKIVHIGSGSTYFGTPGSGGYAASKVVLNQLTQTMAVEWGPHNIQVNTVCPTVTETKFLKFVAGDALHEKMREKLKSKIPLNRLLNPADIAPTVLFLASEGAQLINGAIILIDGGARFVST